MTDFDEKEQMMTDLHYRPAPENKLPAAIAGGAFALAAFFFVLSGAGIGYLGIWQSLVLVFGAIGIYFLFRYHLSYRTFQLNYLNGRHVLVVTDTQGRRISTACYLYLDEMTDLFFVTKENTLPRDVKKRKGKRFTYRNSLCPKETIVIFSTCDFGDVRVTLGANEIFYRALCMRREAAQAERVTDDEE